MAERALGPLNLSAALKSIVCSARQIERMPIVKVANDCDLFVVQKYLDDAWELLHRANCELRGND